MAEILSVRQVTVVVLDIQEPDESQIGGSIAFYQCDVSDKDAVKRVAAKIVEEIGHPTILINNAGIVRSKLVLDNSDEDIELTIGVNLTSHFWTVREFLPNMIEKNHGHIVTVASALSMTGAAQAAAYSASKYGLIGMHESIRQEILSRYKKPGIQTTLVCPGLIHTGMFRGTVQRCEFMTPGLEPVQVAKEIMKAIDQGRSTEIHIPFYVGLLPLMRMMPIKLNDWIHEISGANTALVNMTGRSKGRTGTSKRDE